MKRLATLILLVSSAGAFAQAPLTLDDCLLEAVHNNPSLAAAREAVAKARFNKAGSYANLLPQVSAEGSVGKSETDTDEGKTSSDSVRGALSVDQSLFTGGRNRAAVEQGKEALLAEEEQLRRMEADLTYAVKSAFARVLHAREYVSLAEKIARRREAIYQLVQLRYEGGREHKGSLMSTEAAWRQSQFEVETARRALSVANLQLARQLGWKDRSASDARGELAVPAVPAEADYAALARGTPEYRYTAAQERSARAGVASAESSFWPQLSAGGSVSRSGDDWPPEDDAWSVSARLTYPLFSGGSDLNSVRAARAERRRMEASLSATEDEVVVSLAEAHADFADAAGRVAVQERYLDAAKTRAEIAEGQYTSGLLSFENWDLIENDLIEKQKALLASRLAAVVAAANWEKTQGLSALPGAGL